MNNKPLILLQARYSSKRLPGKVLKKINGIPLVVLCAKRLSNKGNKLIVLTSKEKSDDRLVKILKNYNISYFRGKLNNVLSRYQEIAKHFKNKNKILVRATSDNPLPDGNLVEAIYNKFKKLKKSYLRIDYKVHNLPKGTGLEIFSAKKILSLNKNLSLQDLEHVTLKIYKKNKINFSPIFKNLKLKQNLSDQSLSVDTNKEYILVKKIFRLFKNPVTVNYQKLIKAYIKLLKLNDK